MKKLKSLLRMVVLAVLLLLAVMGIAMVPIFPRREPMNKENMIEWVVTEEEDELP
jgi:hypothetical protein